MTITIDALVVAESHRLAVPLARDLSEEIDVDELEPDDATLTRHRISSPDVMSRAASMIDPAGDVTIAEWLKNDDDDVAVIAHNRRFARKQQRLPGVSA